MDDWIKHEGSEPPELAPAALVEFPDIGDISDGCVEHFVERCEVRECPWVPGMSYRQLRDGEGIPYISADGLEEWAEYVATYEDGVPFQFAECPFIEPRYNYWDSPGDATQALDIHYHPGDWKESLYRVWKD